MRITDDRLDELVDVFVEGRGEVNDHAAVLLALAELQDRRDDEYDDANDNYETALDIVQAAHPEDDYSWADEYGVSWDDEEAYLAGDGIPDDDRFVHVPPWDFDPDVGDDDDDTF
jgi:uncharacterized protein YciU (UPF0263 family)